MSIQIFLKAIFQKFYLVHSLILRPKCLRWNSKGFIIDVRQGTKYALEVSFVQKCLSLRKKNDARSIYVGFMICFDL